MLIIGKFGSRLRIIRKERKLTLEQLGSLCGTSDTVIRNYEKSRRMPNVSMLILLCNVLKVSPDYLLQDELLFKTDTDEVFNTITQLTPKQHDFLRDFLNTLKKQ